MNWLTSIKTLGDKIKRNFKKKFPSKEEIENSRFQAKNCCNSGIILKEDLQKIIINVLIALPPFHCLHLKDSLICLEKIIMKF